MRDKQSIVYAAFCIMELECGASCKGITERFQRQRSNKHTWLDWAINITKRLPGGKKEVDSIFDWARGVIDENHTVKKFVDSIPEQVWVEGEHIANII